MKKILIHIVLLIMLYSNAAAQSYIFDNYTQGDGLPSDVTISINQSKCGFMFFGTINGLSYFDGEQFYSVQDSILQSEQITNIFSSSDSIMYVGHLQGFSTISKLNVIKHYKLDIDEEEGLAYCFYEFESPREILIGTRCGVFTFSDKKVIKERKFSFLDSSRVYQIASDGNSNIYFATSTGLHVYFSQLNTHKLIVATPTYSLLNKNHEIYGLTSEGLCKTNSSNFEYLSTDFKAKDRFSSLLEDNKGNLVFQQGKVIYFFDGNKVINEISNKNDSPIRSEIDNLFFDKNYSLWIGTSDHGIFLIKDFGFQYFSTHFGIKSNVFGIWETNSGDIFIGTDGQGLLKLNQNHFEHVKWSDEISGTIWEMFQDSKKNIWLSSTDSIYLKNKNTLVNLTQKYNLQTSTGMTFLEHENKIWIPTSEKGLFIYDLKKNILKEFPENEKLKNYFSYKVIKTNNNTLWLLQNKYLHKIVNEKLVEYPFKKEMSSYEFSDIISDENSNLILTTLNHGILFLNTNENQNIKNAIQFFHYNDGLPKFEIFSSLLDKNGNLWIMNSKGFIIFDYKTFLQTGEKEYTEYTTRDLVLGEEYNQFSSLEDTKGNLWFGGINKLVKFVPDDFVKPTTSFKPFIKDFFINYNNISKTKYKPHNFDKIFRDGYKLPYYLNNISIKFSAVDFSNYTTSKFSYKLLPLQNNYSDFSNDNQINLVSLPPNKYKLLIKSKNRWGSISEPEILEFEITPAFYQTNIFYIFSLLLFILFIYFVIKFRTKKFIIKAEEYKKLAEEKEQIANEMELAKNDYFNLFEATYNPVIIIDIQQFKIMEVNESACILLGYPRNELLTKSIREFLNFSEEVYKQHAINLAITGSTYQISDVKIFNKDKKPIIGEVRAKRQNYKGTKCAVLVIRNITEEKIVENNLTKSKEKLTKLEQIKADFLAQMSHEIRTPFSAILSHIELVKTNLEEKLDEDINFSFSSIERATNRIIRTMELILNKAELDTGDFTPNFQPLNLQQTISSVKTEFDSLAVNKGLLFNLDFSNEDYFVNADLHSLRHIFTNLIDNAIKYTKEGEINISLIKKNDKVTVEIQDTGIGIDNEFLPYIFDSFSQEGQGYKRKFDGNGLGLAVVKKYCDINKIKIDVKSEKGMGTTFILTFDLVNKQ